MIATLRKWGHSLAVRIPKPIADQLDVAAGGALELTIEGDRLVLTPVSPAPHYDLDDLMDAMSPANLHAEVETGSAVGNEFS